MNYSKQQISKARQWKLAVLLGLLLTHGTFGQVVITNLASLGGAGSSATALNNLGEVAGFALLPGASAQHAVVVSGGALYDLGTLGGTFSLASGINDSSQVIGSALTAGDLEFHAFLRRDGVTTDLGTLGGPESTAVAINNFGQVIGNSQLAGGNQRAFLYSGGTMVNLGALGGSGSWATALNSLGQVVGHSYVTNDAAQHAFLCSGGSMLDLGTLGGPYSFAASVNDAAQIVGESYPTNLETHAFISSPNGLVDLGTLGGTYSTAYVVNRAGQVIGDSTTTNDAQYHGFFFQNGTMTDLGTLGGDFTSTSALNNFGQVVGGSDDANHVNFPFLWQNGVMVDLNSLLPPNSGWQLLSASLINDLGQIVGYGSSNGSPRWFLMTVPLPNRPPVADAGPNQTVECSAAALLDGSKSTDPENGPLSFEWREGVTVLGTSPTLSVQLPLGSHLITLKVNDNANASSESTVTVNVVDTTPPIVACFTLQPVAADGNGVAATPDVMSGVLASDNCTYSGSLVRSQSPAAGTLFGVGTYPITVQVADSSGNIGSCSIAFNVVDSTPPSVTCPGNITISGDANSQAAIPDLLANLSVSDNCTPPNQIVKSQNPPAGTVVGLGVHEITVTVADAAGNVSTCNTSFEVLNPNPLTLTCPPPVTSPEHHGRAPVPEVRSGVVVVDNAAHSGHLTKTQDPPAGTLVGVGVHPIVVTVSDAAGNNATCTTSFTVVDSTAPAIHSAIAHPDSLVDPQGQMVPVAVSVVASDDCDPAPLTRIVSVTCNEPAYGSGGQTSPDWEITGPLSARLRAVNSLHAEGRVYTLKLQCSDASGNVSTRSVTVKVAKRSNQQHVASSKR